jgi:predicted nucleotidyltransferase
MKTLNDLLKILSESDIEFVVVGGFAGVLHGSTLVTRDLDLCTVLTPENIERLRQVLKDFHPKHRMTPSKLPFSEVPTAGQALNNLYLETDLGVVDFLSSITGLGDFDYVRSNADEITLNGNKVLVMSLENLIRAKEAMNREKDRLAVKELKAIQAKKK